MTAAEQDAPILSRRHATGAESARSLLFTVLGELVLPTGGTAWTSAFIDVLGRLDVEEKAARQALMRTAGDGWLASERVGRRTRWHLTPAAVTLLRDGTERIFGFTARSTDWDGTWTMVLARTTEADRATRHLLRSRLAWAGFGNPAPGIWMSPGSGRAAAERTAQDVLDRTGLADGQIFTARHRGGSELARMVRQAWDLDDLAGAYREFLDEFGDDAAADADAVARVVDLVHAWRRFPWIDPGLPEQFLPDPWDGARAAELFARLHASWVGPARDGWAALNPSA